MAFKETPALGQHSTCKAKNKLHQPSKGITYSVPQFKGNMKCVTSHPSQTTVSEQEPGISNKIEVHCCDLGYLSYDQRRYVHATVDFSAYIEFKLRPLKDVELPESVPRVECEIVDLGIFGMAMGEDWRMRQGGVLFTIGEYGDFFNSISGYHTAGTTFIEEWDTLFKQLHSSQYRKNIVPCMASPWLLRMSIDKG
jgi:hypothetical protein